MPVLERLLKGWTPVAERLDRTVGWERLPYRLGLATLIGLRSRLRERNLYDTGVPAATEEDRAALRDPQVRATRRTDGALNDTQQLRMGAVRAPFGRNAPPVTQDVLGSPTPREVSQALMTRPVFQPATGLNILAAAWLQFEVHDWMNHAKDEASWELEPGMPVPKALRGPGPVNYICGETHWWDASQLYGSKALFSRDVRAGEGEIMVDGDLLRDMEQAIENANSPEANLWVGLAALHILFAREHNAIARRLREVYPHWDADRVYNQARLINCAVMAKIHTVEWTPALIGHPTTVKAIKATWWGLLGQGARRRTGGTEIWTGVPGSRLDHHGIPYSLTEEFVTVYRMHPLIPDEFRFTDLADRPLGAFDLRELAVQPGHTSLPRERIEELGGLVNVLYSLGRTHPGEIELHNYPRVMQSWPRIALPPVDLAAVDIVRTRETGVPRYNGLRHALRLRPAQSFADISKRYGDEIREVYNGDLDAVDAVVGLYGEAKPRNFGFSETAFRVFLLMATRRLQSDRFFTTDYTPETYTPVGLRWIDETTMVSLIRRHYPALAPALEGVENVFTPWRASSGR